MAWPADDLVTDDLDSGTDRPPRAEFFKLFQRVKAIIAARSAAGGIAALDATGKVPDAQIGRGSAGGVASLDGTGRLPVAQAPLVAPPTIFYTGEIRVFGFTPAPDGWLWCDGSYVSTVTYADLYSVIGTTFGNVLRELGRDDRFQLPDFQNGLIAGTSSQASQAIGTVDLVHYEENPSTPSVGDTFLLRALVCIKT